MSYQLKIKAKSLAAEAQIIRAAEHKLKRHQLRAIAKNKPGYADDFRTERLDLQAHRKGIVRIEARATHLARTFLSGKPYTAAEKKRYLPPDWIKIWTMIQKYGVGDLRELAQRFEQWKQAGNDEVKKINHAP